MLHSCDIVRKPQKVAYIPPNLCLLVRPWRPQQLHAVRNAGLAMVRRRLSKYIEKSDTSSLRTIACASLDHLLNDVTAFGNPNSKLWYLWKTGCWLSGCHHTTIHALDSSGRIDVYLYASRQSSPAALTPPSLGDGRSASFSAKALQKPAAKHYKS